MTMKAHLLVLRFCFHGDIGKEEDSTLDVLLGQSAAVCMDRICSARYTKARRSRPKKMEKGELKVEQIEGNF